MPANADEKVAELLKPMLKKRLFVALSKAVAPREDLLPFVVEHLAYMNHLESAGKLFASGPFVQEGVGVGDGQGGAYSGGVLASFRFLFTAHQGPEVDYGYTRDTDQYATINGPSGVQADMHEFSAGYVYRVSLGRVKPFASTGVGGVVFDPLSGSGFLPVAPTTQACAAFVYSVGADITITSHLSFRAQYRGLVYKAPDFGTGIGSDSAMNMSEPAGGLVWRF